MSIIYRSVKGSKLTSAEVDGNFQYLENLVGGAGNAITTQTGFSLVGQDLTINANWIWQILNISYTNASSVLINIPFASSGNQRIDLIVANQSNTFERIAGIESVSNPSAPSVPTNKIFVTFITVTDGTLSSPTPPITGSQFKQKNESQKITQVLGGTNAVIDLRTFGQQYYSVVGPVTSVAGFSKALLTATPTAEVPYNGKDFFFENKTDHDVTLKDNFSGVDVKLNLDADLVVPSNGIVWLKYDAATEILSLFFKSWSEVVDISGKQDKVIIVSSNTTATNDSKYNVVATANFTDPASPVEGKGFEVFVRNGTATIGGTAYAVGSYVIRVYHSGSWTNTLVGGNPKKSIEYNVASLCSFNFPATSNWTYQTGSFGMGAYGSARGDSAYSNFLSLIASSSFTKVIGGIAPYNMKLTASNSVVVQNGSLVGGDLKLVVGYVELNYATGALTNATLVDAGTYTPNANGHVDLREDFGGEITIPKGAIWCYSWAHTKTSAVTAYLQTILNFEEV